MRKRKGKWGGGGLPEGCTDLSHGGVLSQLHAAIFPLLAHAAHRLPTARLQEGPQS